MTDRLKKTFKTASIISYATAVVLFLFVITLFLEVSFVVNLFSDAYMLVFNTSSVERAQSFISSFILYGLFTTIINYYVAGLYKLLSELPEKVVVHRLGMLLIIELFQLLFGLVVLPPFTVVAPIIAGIATLKLVKITQKITQNQKGENAPSEIPLSPKVAENLIEKINQLKREKEEGLYSEEEYMVRLNRLLENSLN